MLVNEKFLVNKRKLILIYIIAALFVTGLVSVMSAFKASALTSLPESNILSIRAGAPYQHPSCGQVRSQEIVSVNASTGEVGESFYSVQNPCEGLSSLHINPQRTKVIAVQLGSLRMIDLTTYQSTWGSNSGGCSSPKWSPDGTSILCVKSFGTVISFHNGTNGGYTSQVNLANPNLVLSSADWLPGGQGFIASGYDKSVTCGLSYSGGIWYVDNNGSTSPVIAPSCARDGLYNAYPSIAVAPNQSSFAYVLGNSSNGRNNIRTANLDGTNNQTVAVAGSDSSWSQPVWSLDSKEIFANFLNPSTGGEQRIEKIRASTGSRSTILMSNAMFNYATPTSGISALPISAPTNLSANSPTQEPQLTWNDLAEADSYNIYRDNILVGSATANSYIDTFAPEGSYTYTVTAVDSSGESGPSNSIDVLIDRTKPSIAYTIIQTPNNFGWNNSDVTVSFSCSDNNSGSGVLSCSSPIHLHIDGENQAVSGTVTDIAGNTTSVSLVVNIDTINPSITKSLSSIANNLGWNNQDVTVGFNCDDFLSGINICTQPIVISTETTGQNVEGRAEDKAGNVAVASETIKLDKTAPSLTNPTWTSNPKTITGSTLMSISATESLSGVSEAEYFIGDTDPGVGNGATMQTEVSGTTATASVSFNSDFPTGVYKISARVKDAADNWSSLVSDYLVVYNPDGPRMTGKRTIVPSLNHGDMLPGLTSSTQTDKAKFGFSVKYNSQGKISNNSDFQFAYDTGIHCNSNNPNNTPLNCHHVELNSSNIAWLTTQGHNDSEGIFEGTGILKVDNSSQLVTFRINGVDGERLNPTSLDQFSLSIFTYGADTNSATPLYKVNTTNITRGNIKIVNQ